MPATAPSLTQRHHETQAALAAAIAVLQEEHRRLVGAPVNDEVLRDLRQLAAGAREGLVLVAMARGQRESAAHAALNQRLRAHLA